jgi:hypothetical protein
MNQSRQPGNLFECAWFVEKVRLARDREFALLVSASSIRCNIPLGPIPAQAGVLTCLPGEGNPIALTVEIARTMKSFSAESDRAHAGQPAYQLHLTNLASRYSRRTTSRWGTSAPIPRLSGDGRI